MESGWYNGHYHKGNNGNWFRESYAILVVGVKDFCDVAIQFDKISVSTKLKRNVVLAYCFEKFSGYEFEAYGVEDYLADFYHAGQTIQELKKISVPARKRKSNFPLSRSESPGQGKR